MTEQKLTMKALDERLKLVEDEPRATITREELDEMFARLKKAENENKAMKTRLTKMAKSIEDIPVVEPERECMCADKIGEIEGKAGEASTGLRVLESKVKEQRAIIDVQKAELEAQDKRLKAQDEMIKVLGEDTKKIGGGNAAVTAATVIAIAAVVVGGLTAVIMGL